MGSAVIVAMLYFLIAPIRLQRRLHRTSQKESFGRSSWNPQRYDLYLSHYSLLLVCNTCGRYGQLTGALI